MPTTPRSPQSEVRYAAVAGLRLRAFDDDAVVFEPLTWDAHVLNPAAHAVLELLLDAPRSEAEVAAFLHDALTEAERAHAEEHARRLLGELQALGLVETVEGRDDANV